MNLFRGELVDRSLHYYFLSAVRREVLVVGKYISGLATSIILFTATTVIAMLLLYIANEHISTNQPIWIQLDYRAADSTASADPSDNSGFTLTGLIDIFSRRNRGEHINGFEEAGPLRLDRLKKR